MGAPLILALWDFTVSIQADLLCFCCVRNERDRGTAVGNDDMGMQTPCWGYPVRWGGWVEPRVLLVNRSESGVAHADVTPPRA